MTPEEFQRIKEAEKDHLRKIRELKKANKQFVQHSKITKAVTDMATGMNELYDEHREMVDRLQMGAMQNEARLEVGLDSVAGGEPSEAMDEAALEAHAEALRKARAQELIRQMKMEGSTPGSGGPSSAETSSTHPSGSKESASAKETSDSTTTKAQSTSPAGRTPLTEKPKPSSSSNLPEKTIGKMKP